MAAPTIYQNVTEDGETHGPGQLFSGKKFWVAQRVPSRGRLLENIKANGGVIVMLEKKADYLIADHFRRDCPPGSISYEFVEKSIQDGRLRDPENHRAGPLLGVSREAGAINRPTKSARTPYTAEEDRILYKWVRDYEAAGGKSSGNEIYKQLEEQYPAHTWQSWRDRYLKQLRTRPPSAFGIAGNASPSLPSDRPTEQTQPQSKDKVSGLGKARTKSEAKEELSLDQLAELFSSEDWEELYAFVEEIQAASEQDDYQSAWEQWAKSQDNQTAEQWRQYYEKVVRPQWLRDPESKRKRIRDKIKIKHNESPSQTQDMTDGANEQEEEPSSANKDKPSTNNANPVEEDTVEGAAKELANHHTRSQPTKMPSSSTAQYESPKYMSKLYDKIQKRAHEEVTREDANEQEKQSPPTKRQKSASPLLEMEQTAQDNIGTQIQPLEISSGESSAPTSQSEEHAHQASQQLTGEAQYYFGNNTRVPHRKVEDMEEVDSVESEDLPVMTSLPLPPQGVVDLSDDDALSNTPTPRPNRQRPSRFDTQAILSSPSQEPNLSRLPRPPNYTQDETDHRSSSLAPHPESEASTTQSIEDFRRSLTDLDAKTSYPTSHLPRPASPSPAPSSSSSTGSGDPDVPLAAEEIDDFYSQLQAEGILEEFITKALKRTRCRPGLAEIVLDAWIQGKPLPNQRGIWSLEDDEAVESGDGIALAKLERKHTLDGWGGVTERMAFLGVYRNR